MIDPFARTLLASSQVPFNNSETSPFLGISYLRKIAKVYFNTPEEINVSSIKEELSRLSLVSSMLTDENIDEKDMATAFLIAESAEVAFDDAINSSEDITEKLASITHLLDIASFFHLADFDANANVLATKALSPLNEESFDKQELVSQAQISYYRSLGYFLRGRFGDLITESQKELTALSIQDHVYIRLISFLIETTNYYRGLGDVSAKSIADLQALSELLSSSGLYPIISSEISRLLSFENVVERKALYPLLVDKLSGQGAYLDYRISGISDGAYPFAWPSVRTFCEDYLGEKNHHAVIALPTGSGKSFLAELAIVDSIQKGWILYLAPTNALCAQIKNDLNRNLVATQNSEINFFVGGSEYLPDIEQLDPVQNHIAVMTPEKASLLLKLYPEKAKNCSLMILDECHVLGESSRGAITEFVLSSMISASENLHVIFMSALLGNPDRLVNWLHLKTGKSVALFQNDWRPTRSSRIILTQDWDHRTSSIERGRTKYFLPIVAVSDAYTPWTQDNDHYFSWPTNLFIKSKDPNRFEPSKNELAKDLAISFATQKLQTLVIIFSSKHNVFSTAEKIKNLPENMVPQNQLEFDWLEIANYELGLQSKVQDLISNNQVSVHSAIMLQSERKASEDAYNRGRTKVMVSTTTLAQGLNLNSQVVILAGTEFYVDPNEYDDEDALDIEVRSLQQVLNGCGRAARANMANRGFSVIIPSPRIVFPSTEVKTTIINSLPVISSKESIFAIASKIQELLRQVQLDDQNALPNSSEVQLILLLPTNRQSAESFLNSTLASIEFDEEQLSSILNRLDQIKSMMTEGDIPEWLLQVAHLSNIDIRFIIQLRDHVLSLGQEYSFESYEGLALFLVDWLEQLNPHETWEFLLSHVKRWRWYWGDQKDPAFADQVKSDETILDNSKELLTDLWQNLKTCITLWLSDGTFLEIGNALVRGKCDTDKFARRSHAGFPIPRAIVWSQKTMDKLSAFAGALSALRDTWQTNDSESLPKWLAESQLLQSLPMAIRFGVSNPTSLTWHRSVIGERRVSNLLSQLIPISIENPLDEDQVRSFLGNARKYLSENEDLVNENELVIVIRRLAL